VLRRTVIAALVVILSATAISGAIVSAATGGDSHDGGPEPSGAGAVVTASAHDDPVFMSYWEARRAGYVVSALPAETGLRVCTDADFHHGFSSAEELERSLTEYEVKWGEEGPDTCQVDPTTTTIAVFPPGRGLPSMLP
jgi:hypothetical protein